MDAIGLANSARTTPNAPWIPFFVGLMAAGAVAGVICRLPSPHSLSWLGLFTLAVAYIMAFILTSAIATWSMCAILPDAELLDRRPLISVTMAGAAWIPLLVLLFRENSLWALAIAVFVSAGVTKSWHTYRKLPEGDNADPPEDFSRHQVFHIPDSPSLFRRILPALCASTCAEAGIVAVCTNHLLAASVLLGISASIVTWHLSRRSAHQETRSNARTKLFGRRLLFLTLALLLTSVALTPYLANRSLIAKLHVYFFVRVSPPVSSRRKRYGLAQPTSKGYSSIILWPVPKKHPKIVPPSPHTSTLQSGQRTVPLVIPFDGVYWYFKAPYKRPRPDARVDRGTPITTNVRSTDLQPLKMEARQSLGRLISLDCCKRIDVTVQNADHYSGNVSLELTLIDTTLPGKPSVSLGRKVVATRGPLEALHRQPPAIDTLHFDISRSEKIRQFNEVVVIFRRIAPARALVGAKIAIQQFKLIPREQ